MFCTKCGAQIPAAAHFCPGCGIAVAAAGATDAVVPDTAVAAQPPRLPRARRSMPLLIAGALLVIAIAVLAFVLRRPAPPVSSTAPPATSVPDGAPPPAATPAALTTPATPAFDWSGLSHEDLLKARNSLDAAIAREEHSSSGGTAAQATAQ